MASRALSRSLLETSKADQLSSRIVHADSSSTYPIKEDFLRAAESQGIPVVDDLQDLSTGHGAEHWLKWINRDVRLSPFPVPFAAKSSDWAS